MSGEELDYWLNQGLKPTCGQLVFQSPNAVTLSGIPLLLDKISKYNHFTWLQKILRDT